ncbi:hypothetical protein [Novosphingobium sp.]|uniref:hypothetical protein n=1 Tax=Novosphingobium sp. TaxID=1874826 RepID=UPI003BA8AE24
MAILVLVLAFALRALIPQGMMTAPDAARGITVLLCDGSGAAARLAVPIGEKPGKTHAAQICPFAVLAQTGAAGTPGGWTIAPRMQPALPQQGSPETVEPAKTYHAHPPARAPPVAA